MKLNGLSGGFWADIQGFGYLWAGHAQEAELVDFLG
jgi:hypothetical protein